MAQPKPEPIFWLGDARGIYIPRDFARSFTDRDKYVTGVSAEDWAVLDAGPDHESYWDTWLEVCERAVVLSEGGVRYMLNQDGDLWLIPEGMEWSDELDAYVWPATEEESNDDNESGRQDAAGESARDDRDDPQRGT